MKRSQVNSSILWAIDLLKKNNFYLPDFAYWKEDEWRRNRDKTETIKKVMLGWDVTDYGLDRFEETGGVLFTIRNGSQKEAGAGVPYAEKCLLFKDGQGLPTHFHFTKTEDIINRGGGILALKLYNALPDYSLDTAGDVIVYRDGVRNVVRPGEVVRVAPGSSISLTPYMYHNFWALEGYGDLIAGEVSSVNDDNQDNHFYENLPRFGSIEEDEPMLYPLVAEYDKL
jgi:D-lyxose ketol-isomerase